MRVEELRSLKKKTNEHWGLGKPEILRVTLDRITDWRRFESEYLSGLAGRKDIKMAPVFARETRGKELAEEEKKQYITGYRFESEKKQQPVIWVSYTSKTIPDLEARQYLTASLENWGMQHGLIKKKTPKVMIQDGLKKVGSAIAITSVMMGMNAYPASSSEQKSPTKRPHSGPIQMEDEILLDGENLTKEELEAIRAQTLAQYQAKQMENRGYVKRG